MSRPQLGIALLTLLVLIVFASYRHRRYRPDSLYDFGKLTIDCVGVATAVGYVVVPAVWFTISFSFNGGRVEDNLFPGSDVDGLAISLIVGALLTTWAAVRAYLPHIGLSDEED